MARRKSKAKPRSRSKPKLNLVDIGVSLAVANAVSTNVTGLNLRNFFLAGTSYSEANRAGYGVSSTNHNQLITLKEMFGGPRGSGSVTPIGEALMNNLKANAIPLTIAVVGIPIVAMIAKKTLRAPVLTPMNKLLKMTGLGVKV
jgi:hypothetical protein